MPRPPNDRRSDRKPDRKIFNRKLSASKPEGSGRPFGKPKQSGGKPYQPGSNPKRSGGSAPDRSGLWLYGVHAVRAALNNPRRKILKAVLTERSVAELGAKLLGRVRYETMSLDEVGRLLPQGAVHQGVAIQCEKLPKLTLEDALPPAVEGQRRIVLVLDQITDPHNAGAILRTAVAFGVSVVVVQDRHAPPESGVLAKAASGALDIVSYVEVVNISRALEQLGKAGFWRVALAGDGDTPLTDAVAEGDVVLVLGSEGSGVRRLVRENCDVSAFVPIDSQMDSLNVSNAAAIALYELRRA